MDFERGQIVESRAGHDKGKLFFVLAVEGDFLLLADGKSRKADHAKRKRRKHTAPVGMPAQQVMEQFRSGQTPADSELRRALAKFRDEFRSVQGGNTLGKERYD